MDHLTKLARSKNMGRIRSTGTAPERVVVQLARRLGRSFKTHARTLPGAPDLAFFKLRKVVFVHGCFWHQHPHCHRSNLPKSNRNYWVPKLAGNAKRDRAHRRRLNRLGWKTMTVWECECAHTERVARRLERFITGATEASGLRRDLSLYKGRD
jgi:DNA mismatch endonuclease (patch repair protein)